MRLQLRGEWIEVDSVTHHFKWVDLNELVNQLLLLQDPTCWEDVLTKGAVTGTCQADGCHGETSVRLI